MNNTNFKKTLEEKRRRLNALYLEQGLNNYTLKKSQELDILIALVQRKEFKEYIENNI